MIGLTICKALFKKEEGLLNGLGFSALYRQIDAEEVKKNKAKLLSERLERIASYEKEELEKLEENIEYFKKKQKEEYYLNRIKKDNINKNEKLEDLK